MAVWNRYQRRSQPPSLRASLRGGAQPRPRAEARAHFADDSDQRVDDEELIGRALALVARLPASRTGGLRALRVVRAQLRGRGFVLGIPVGTVRSHLSRAVPALAEELDPDIDMTAGRTPMIKEAVGVEALAFHLVTSAARR